MFKEWHEMVYIYFLFFALLEPRESIIIPHTRTSKKQRGLESARGRRRREREQKESVMVIYKWNVSMGRFALVVERRDPRERRRRVVHERARVSWLRRKETSTRPAFSSFASLIGDRAQEIDTRRILAIASRLFLSFLFSAILIYINNNNSQDCRGLGETRRGRVFESRMCLALLYVFV